MHTSADQGPSNNQSSAHVRASPTRAAKKIWLSIHRRNFWGSWWYICLSVHLHHTETNVKGLNYFLASVSATWYCTSLLWSIGCCQNMLSTDQYDMTINYPRCRPIEVTCMCWQVTSFQLTTGSTPSGFLYNGYKLFI